MKRLFAMFIVIFSIAVLSGCDGLSFRGQDNTLTPVFDEGDQGLAHLQDYEALQTLLGHRDDAFNERGLPSIYYSMDELESDASPPLVGSEAKPEHSETNVQVAGVDEGDIVKTDGTYIYTISNRMVFVVEVLGDGEMECVFAAQLDEDIHGRYDELYVTDDVFIVIGSYYRSWDSAPYSGDDTFEGRPGIFWPGIHFGRTTTFVKTYDIGTFELRDEYELSGNALTTRLIDDDLYVITRKHIYLFDDVDPRPVFTVNGDVTVPEYTDIKYVPGMQHETFTVIAHIDVSENASLKTKTLLDMSGWPTVYVNHDGLFMAARSYKYENGRFSYEGWVVSYLFNETGGIEFGGAGQYEGHLLNQFAMDEYEGHLRMVTTEGWGDSVVNRLYVFERTETDGKRQLEVVGLIDEGLGKPRETVRSVRFDGPQAFVVTYELTDPFYVIDLSDPKNPFIEGELEITGFSTYLHPWSDTLVLGIGYEADGITTLGIKLALYDVSDETKPVEAGEPLVLWNDEEGWQYGEALHNHKAILVAVEHGFFGFSINRSYFIDGQFSRLNDYIVFGVDAEAEKPISVLTRISHYALYEEDAESYDNDTRTSFTMRDYNIRRAIFIGSTLYCVSGEAITAHAMDEDFAEVNALILAIDDEKE